MIKLLRSSAGSGKTYNLAKTYIRLLLQSDDRYAYRHILAVTFTNKATAEMKNRILKELDRLAHTPEKSPYIKEFAPAFGGVEKVQRRAAALLKDILHDYSAFSVSTIDKFFQQALRAFARELGQFSSYQIELNKEALVRESADRILESIGSGEASSDIRKWLMECLMDQLGQNGRMSLDFAMESVVKQLKSDEMREVMELHSLRPEDVFSRNYLKAVRSECAAIQKSFKAKVADAAGKVLEGMKAAGLEYGDFSGSFKIATLEATVADGSKRPTDGILKNADNPEKWFVKAKQHLVPVAEANMAAPFAALKELCTGKEYLMYNTAGLLAAQVYTLGFALELDREYKALADEKNVVCLDDSNLTLRDIIAGSDAPFIYEKLGVRYQNFLLDEFQDTSTIQWENFKPLLAESDASGGSNLLVGDVKQSIYRWRGGDWTLLNNGVKSQFPAADDSDPLRDNWRSLSEIVEFNNKFFDFAARVLDGKLGGTLVQGIYADASQTARADDKARGYVKCTFCESKDEELQQILESIGAAREAGATYGQIAVLVRKNDQGSDVAAFLTDNGIPVISDDSMEVKSSVTVRRLVSLLSCMDNEADAVNKFLAKDLGVDLPSSYDSLYSLAEELLRSLRHSNTELFDGEVLYIQSFMDILLDWSSSNGNSLSGFLKYWDGEKPKISSPDGIDAVRIMTIHKSKGLEFPYLIYPFAGEEPLYKATGRWCVPARKDGASELISEGVFNVNLSSKSVGTVFADQYRQEEQMQFVDNINTFYVAMTRAEKVLHTIAVKPSKPGSDFKCFADILYAFTQTYGTEFGEIPGQAGNDSAIKVDTTSVMPDLIGHLLSITFRSWSLRGRMRSTGTGAEVFSSPVMPDLIGHLPRLKGIVMHKILSDVTVASDLPAAVDRAVAAGLVEPAQASAYLSLLQSKLEEVKDYHWFDEISPLAPLGRNDKELHPVISSEVEKSQTVLNEVGIIDSDGGLHRPDRVVIGPDGTVTVIDYKFGEDHPGYAAQVRRYCNLFRSLGYASVRGYLWFVSSSTVTPVE